MGRLLIVFMFSVALCVAQKPKPERHTEIVKVPKAAFALASAKAKLVKLMIDSLLDEGKGKIDWKRETEIRRLNGENSELGATGNGWKYFWN